LGEDELAALEVKFITDEKVQEAYLKHIRYTKSQLSPEEMGAAAEWLGKELHLYTLCKDGNLRPPQIYNKGAGVNGIVRVVLSKSHYERALFTPTCD
jgi:hypothetical protein